MIPPSGLIPGDNYHLVFTTSSLHGLDTFTFLPPFNFPRFGGVDAADWVVSNAASAAGLFGGWDGFTAVYRAVLSNDTENAKDRVNIMTPVYNAAGQLVATGEADFFDGQIENLMNFDENGVVRTGVVWTGTSNSGNMTADTCGDNWNNNSSGVNGTVGDSTSLLSPFSGAGTRACNTVARLYGVSPLLTVPFPEPGDYDGDEQVGPQDYAAWKTTFGQSVPPFSGADGNGNGVVDAADYTVWLDNLGFVLGGGPPTTTEWITPATGDFGTGSNWTQGVPGTSDIAGVSSTLKTLSHRGQTTEINVTSNVTNQALRIGKSVRQNVLLDLRR